MERSINPDPLVSVIIPCFNHGKYLPEAIQSVLEQSYGNIEIIVVDDGSKDDTAAVCQQFPSVKYVYQSNQGLSAARNTGTKNSIGDLLVYLDADDLLLKDGISINVDYFRENPSIAFVSGAHIKQFLQSGKTLEEKWPLDKDHYLQLLQCNYIGMHATVMYARWAALSVPFDPSLPACEDYDVYLRIARQYPVAHHTEMIAVYRFHQENMSSNIPKMLHTVLGVLEGQKRKLRDEKENAAFQKGLRIWKDYYSEELYKQCRIAKRRMQYEEFILLLKYSPIHLYRYYKTQIKKHMSKALKKLTPLWIKRYLFKAGLIKRFDPGKGNIDFGDLLRTKPFSIEFGYDRGGPVDRYYIENFLSKERDSIKGSVLEIGDNEYTLMFGQENVAKSDILHVHADNPKATYVGDLANAPSLPDNHFDCIVLTQTLHLIYDFKAALSTCHRVLKPGGVLLLTVPGITHIDQGEWRETWYWSFTQKAMTVLIGETFSGGLSEVKSYGNVFAATAFLFGVGLPEVSKEMLDKYDPHYQVIITVKATKRKT